MDDGRRVCRLECVRNLGGHAKGPVLADGPGLQDVGQRSPRHVLHGDVVEAAGGLVCFRQQASVKRLMEFLAALGHDVEVRVRPTRKAHGQVSVVVAA